MVCEVKVDDMLTQHAITNSSLHPMVPEFSTRNHGEEALLAIFVLREGARASSRFMPFIKALIDSHEWRALPSTWAANSAEWKGATPLLKRLTLQALKRIFHNYDHLGSLMERFGGVLSEGICGDVTLGGNTGGKTPPAVCSRARLEEVYSRQNFIRMCSIIEARWWHLPMYAANQSTGFMAPGIDLLNFGQMGIIAEFDQKKYAFIATAERPIEKGSELLFFYGDTCREVSVAMYGFAPPSARGCLHGSAQSSGQRSRWQFRSHKRRVKPSVRGGTRRGGVSGAF